jgi:hypothetical protein
VYNMLPLKNGIVGIGGTGGQAVDHFLFSQSCASTRIRSLLFNSAPDFLHLQPPMEMLPNKVGRFVCCRSGPTTTTEIQHVLLLASNATQTASLV